VSDPEEQFDAFVRITEQHLQPTSPQEVNISSQMQAKIASLQDKDKFLGLDGASRRNVLHAPRKEIVRMLEENLLTKFKQSPEVKKLREDQERENLRECIFPFGTELWVCCREEFATLDTQNRAIDRCEGEV